MAEDNQNNQDHSNASFKDQVLRSLRGEEIENDDSASSEHNAQNVSQHNEAEYNRTYRSQPDTQEDPIKRDEMESVGSRSAEHQTRRSDSSEEQSQLGSTRSPKEDNSDKRIRKKKTALSAALS